MFQKLVSRLRIALATAIALSALALPTLSALGHDAPKATSAKKRHEEKAVFAVATTHKGTFSQRSPISFNVTVVGSDHADLPFKYIIKPKRIPTNVTVPTVTRFSRTRSGKKRVVYIPDSKLPVGTYTITVQGQGNNDTTATADFDVSRDPQPIYTPIVEDFVEPDAGFNAASHHTAPHHIASHHVMALVDTNAQDATVIPAGSAMSINLAMADDDVDVYDDGQSDPYVRVRIYKAINTNGVLSLGNIVKRFNDGAYDHKGLVIKKGKKNKNENLPQDGTRLYATTDFRHKASASNTALTPGEYYAIHVKRLTPDYPDDTASATTGDEEHPENLYVYFKIGS